MEVSSLVNVIKEDMKREGSYDRYPVRFLGIKYENGTSATLIQLQQLTGVKFFDIKDLLPHEDAWLTTDNLRKAVYNLDPDKSYLVVGFSEYARFLSENEFITLLLSFLELENDADYPKRRIYFSCFALYSQIKRIVKKYHRRYDEYNPFLNETDVEDLPQIFFISDNLDVDVQENVIINSSEWFGMWRNPEINTRLPIVCSSKSLSFFYSKASPDNVYNIRQIKTYQELLDAMYGIRGLQPYEKSPEEFFEEFIRKYRTSNKDSADQFILSEVKAQSIDCSNIYGIWNTSDIFNRWLVRNYILLYTPKEKYLHLLMTTLEDLSNKGFIEKVYECIFETSNIVFCEDRRIILECIAKSVKDITFSKKMIDYYNEVVCNIIKKETTLSIENIDLTKDDKGVQEKRELISVGIQKDLLPYLTSYSSFERRLCIWLYRQKLLTEKEVRQVYPDLAMYITDTNNVNEPENLIEELCDYFNTYRSCKLAQVQGSEYSATLIQWNGDEDTFYKWYMNSSLEYPEVILKKQGFTGNVYVLDAVGAEFLPFIIEKLNSYGYSAETACYGKCHLPSITSVAQKYYAKEYLWDLTYDQDVIHGGIYYHVDNIEKALATIDRLIEQIIEAEADDIFAITADHGATVGHRLDKKDKKYNFDKAEHDGRCWKLNNHEQINPTNDYIVYNDEDEKEWVIALNQQSLYNTSKYVVHGGATPEEVLVPVLIAHKGKQIPKSYKVRPENLKVSGLNKGIEVKIYPMPQEVTVNLRAKDGTDTEMTYSIETQTWKGELKRGIAQDITISIGLQSFTFKTTSVSMDMKKDDLFDD